MTSCQELTSSRLWRTAEFSQCGVADTSFSWTERIDNSSLSGESSPLGHCLSEYGMPSVPPLILNNSSLGQSTSITTNVVRILPKLLLKYGSETYGTNSVLCISIASACIRLSTLRRTPLLVAQKASLRYYRKSKVESLTVSTGQSLSRFSILCTGLRRKQVDSSPPSTVPAVESVNRIGCRSLERAVESRVRKMGDFAIVNVVPTSGSVAVHTEPVSATSVLAKQTMPISSGMAVYTLLTPEVHTQHLGGFGQSSISADIRYVILICTSVLLAILLCIVTICYC